MIENNVITIDFTEFREIYPELSDATDYQIKQAYVGSGAYISARVGTIALDPDLQEVAVYLSTAHLVYLSLHPDEFRPLNSAAQGGISASFATLPVSSSWDHFLSTTRYGLQLLSILKQIQPLIPDKAGIKGYYGSS